MNPFFLAFIDEDQAWRIIQEDWDRPGEIDLVATFREVRLEATLKVVVHSEHVDEIRDKQVYQTILTDMGGRYWRLLHWMTLRGGEGLNELRDDGLVALRAVTPTRVIETTWRTLT